MRRATTGTFLALGIAFLALIAWSGSARTGAAQTTEVGVNETGVAPPVVPADDVGVPAVDIAVAAGGTGFLTTTGGVADDAGRDPIPWPGTGPSLADGPVFGDPLEVVILPVPVGGTL